jgi:pilus assembly protein CpaE
MNAQTHIALMTPDAAVTTAVTAALQSNGHVLAGPAIRDVRDLSAQLSRSPVPIALIDLDPNPSEVLPHLERIISHFPATRFVALANTLGNELLLEAMQTGVRRVVVKQTMATELRGVLDRLTASDSAVSGPRGDIITLLSASGGCGSTTIAVNLAEEIALKQNHPTLLCDLDCAYGAAAGYLGVHPHYAADHLLNSNGLIDAQLIRSTATVHSDRIHLLASPCSTNYAAAEALRFDRLGTVLDSTRRAYTATVIDAPRLTLDVSAALASSSAYTLLILQLTVKDLRTARAMLDALRERGVEMNSVIPVANRYVKRQLISLEEASKALGGVEVLPIRNDYAPAIQGLNFGQVLAQCAPRSAFRKDLQELLSKLEAKKRTAA